MKSKNTADEFRRRVKSRLALPDGAAILAAVSGGVDSMVLLHVLLALGYKCSVLHVNHKLRGKAADDDAALVRTTCRQWQVPFRTVNADASETSAIGGESLQMAARRLRYDALANEAKARSIGFVAVGHNLNDQAETIVLNLTRGTGPEGLAGMRPMRSLAADISLVRPLLGEARDAIVAYAQAESIIWREDSSNEDESFTRARLREQVMPHLDAVAICRSASIMKDWVEQVLRPSVRRHYSLAATDNRLDMSVLVNLPPVMACRLIMEAMRMWLPGVTVNQDLAKRILGLVETQAGRKIETGNGTVWRGRRALIFSSDSDKGRAYGGLLSADHSIALPQGRLSWQITTASPESLRNPLDAWVDANRVKLPLKVRPWEAGDRVKPLGMTGHKKVSDIMTDNGVPVDRRSWQFVVCSGDDIVWVVGQCLSDDYKVTSETVSFGQLRLEAPEEDKVLFKDAAEIQARVREIGRELAATHADKRPIVIVLLRGAFVFAADLVRAMDFPLEVDFWGLSSYGDALESSGSVKEVLPLNSDVRGRHVIVVEDIVDSGRTLSSVRQKLTRHEPASVTIVTLLQTRDSAMNVDHAGFISDKYFVVGYGLDAAQEMRNLPDLYYLKSHPLTK